MRGNPVSHRVAPDGTVTNEFEGRVHAQGLTIDALEPGGDASLLRHQIRWLRESDGAMVAFIETATLQAANGARVSRWRLTDDAEGTLAELFLTRTIGGLRAASAVAAGHSNKIIDSNGASEMLRVPSKGLGVSGRLNLTFNAGDALSSIVVVNHAISAPHNALALNQSFTGRFIGVQAFTGAGVTEFQAWVNSPFPAQTDVSIAYMVWQIP